MRDESETDNKIFKGYFQVTRGLVIMLSCGVMLMYYDLVFKTFDEGMEMLKMWTELFGVSSGFLSLLSCK